MFSSVTEAATDNSLPAPATAAILAGPTIGSGSDALAVTVSQDAWQSSAEFTIDVNGVQIGGVQTVDPSILNSAGGTELYMLTGDFSSASGTDTIKVNYLNDAWGGTASTDRNLYVVGLSLDGKATSSAVPTELNITEGKSFTVPAPMPAPTPVQMTGPTIGSGPDSLSLTVSQDAWQGSAQFTVDVNGQQIGGVETVDPSVLHSAAGTETFTFKGNFSTASGQDTVKVNFINDAWGGTASTDRNLYVTGVSLDENSPSTQTASLMTNSTASFSVAGPIATPAPAPAPAPTNSFNYAIHYNDPNNYAGGLSSVIQTDLNAALQDFEGKISGIGTLGVELDIIPSTSSNAGELADGGPFALIPQGSLDGKTLEVPSSVNELETGSHTPGYSSDIIIQIPESSLNEIYFDPNPAAGDNIGSVAPNKYDALTIFRHELTHGFGFISLRNSATGTLGPAETMFDHYSSITSSGADVFTGSAAEATYGGPVPITTIKNGEQYSHLGNDPTSPLANDLMSGTGLMNGVTHQVSALDLAILKDIGVPEVSSAGSATIASAAGSSNITATEALQAVNLTPADISSSGQMAASAILGSGTSQSGIDAGLAVGSGSINSIATQPVAAMVVDHAIAHA